MIIYLILAASIHFCHSIATESPVKYIQQPQREAFTVTPSGQLEYPPVRNCTTEVQEKVRQCADPLYSLGVVSDSSSLLSWQNIISKTREYFDQVCENFFLFDLCIEPYKEVCFGTSDTRFSYDSTLRILDFLCRDGYDEMKRSFTCFTRTLTRAEMMQCQAEMVADTQKVAYSTGAETTQQATCGAMRNYVECVRYPVRFECGYRAWQFVKEIIVRPTEILLPGCQISNATTKITIVSTIITILLALM